MAGALIAPELVRWRALGVRPRLWWRDDDTRAPTRALERLLAIAQDRPISLAVIPDGHLTALVDFLRPFQSVTVGQHGIDHVNRLLPGQPPSEYIGSVTHEEVAAAIFEAKVRMTQAGLPPRFFAPPWNAIRPSHAKVLPSVGFCHLSAGALMPAYDGITNHTSDLDLLRWKPAPRFKGAMKLMASLAAGLRQRRRADDMHHPIGLLTHHLDHDEATWSFLAWITKYADRRFDWVGGELFAAGPARTASEPNALRVG